VLIAGARTHRVTIAALIAVVCAHNSWAGPPGRIWGPLIVKGAKMGPVLGARIDRMEVLALHNGRIEPIPFQVDEVLPDGRYALASGPEPLTDDSPGILDKDDELVAMLRDMGDRAASSSGLPPGAVEIEVTDPLDRSHRYAYVAAVQSPLRSPIDYVDYDEHQHVIESEHYRLGFTAELPTDYALQSHKHEGRPNLIDRFKVRIAAKVLAGMFTYRLNEAAVHNRLIAYKDGPVRVVRRVRHFARLALGIRSPEVTSEDFFYRDFIENPFRVKFPWVPRLIFGDVRVNIYLDFIDLRGFTLAWSGMKGDGVRIGDESSERAVIDDPPVVQWVAFRCDGRVMVQTVAPSADLALIDRRLYYSNDSPPFSAPETYPGEHPGVGYSMTGWEKLSRGAHLFDSLLVSAPEGFDPSTLLRELSVAPIVETRVMRPR
jgi:hypothetical protein